MTLATDSDSNVAADPTTAVGTEPLFENDRLRVWKMHLAPGESSMLHKHIYDYVSVYASPGMMEVHNFDGNEPIRQPSAEGFVSYREVGRSGLSPTF